MLTGWRCVWAKRSELLATRGDEHLYNSPGAHQAVWAIPDLGESVVGRGCCGDIDFQI